MLVELTKLLQTRVVLAMVEFLFLIYPLYVVYATILVLR
jgi:hypothetical protein